MIFRWTVPTALTFARILLIPVVITVFYLPFDWSKTASAMLFLLTMVTDSIDGFLARHLQQETPFGKLLDPLADKLVVSSMLIVLVSQQMTFVIVLPAITIIAGDLIASALREWISYSNRNLLKSASIFGKTKTVIQTLSIAFLIYCTGGEVSQQLREFAYFLIYCAGMAVIVSVTYSLYGLFSAHANNSETSSPSTPK